MLISELGGLFASLTGKSESEILGMLYKDPNAEEKEFKESKEIQDYLSGLMSEKIRSVGEDQRKRGTREALTALEKEVKSKYGISSNLQGKELVDFVVQEQKKTVEPKTIETKFEVELTKETALAHPVVQEVIKSKIDPIIKERDDVKTEFATFKANQLAEETTTEIRSQLVSVYDNAKVKLGEGNERTLRLNTLYDMKSFDPSNFKVEKQTDGSKKIIPVDNNGNPLKDAHMNDVTFEKYALSKNPYPVAQFDESKKGSGAGSSSDEGNDGATPSGKPSQAEMIAYLKRDDVTSEQKEAYYQKYMSES